MAAAMSLTLRMRSSVRCFRVSLKLSLRHSVPFLQWLTAASCNFSACAQPVVAGISHLGHGRQLSTVLDGVSEEELKRRIVPGYEKLLQDGEFDDNVAKIFSLEYANKCEWNKLQVKAMVDQLKKAPGDTGSTPVQIGALTVRIQYLTDHMRRNKKDKHCLRSLIRLVHRRRKLLKYLQRKDFVRYHELLSELTLKPPVEQKYKHNK